MGLIIPKSFIYLCCLFALAKICQCKIDVIEVTECRESVEGKGTITHTFDGEMKKIDLTMDLPDIDIKDDATFVLKLHKYDKDKDEWEYDYDEKKGDVCFYIQQFLTKSWDKARSASNPEIEDECVVPKGTYEWKNFELSEDDVIVPIGMSGRYKFDVTVYGDEPLFCFEVDVDVQ
ncbi:uncharacterized protein LOC107397486 [Tribolium castaneum]|uniref:MD-2-related lipid-recognition domain-containing protein n=1 Tax=Tribolium castaneum TaxID=7070 RepID=D6WG74_TRICA|nr:PREDICTED: uncharacterized protein LOC107397486 [Tribolium castaneum]EFA00541.2 hypothetical protein TcasGA2_TC003406 [Tribolium castaneum]|eukprot:XP_015833218.1 PREDICTED: uncharacterized protein LOC107397486 [Tribolium castaneum]